MSDLIRKEDALRKARPEYLNPQQEKLASYNQGWNDALDEYFDRIKSLPSAEPKTGHWVEIEDYNGDIHYQCDQCGEEFILIDGTPKDNNYWHCPNCGSYNGEDGEAVVKGADNESTL